MTRGGVDLLEELRKKLSSVPGMRELWAAISTPVCAELGCDHVYLHLPSERLGPKVKEELKLKFSISASEAAYANRVLPVPMFLGDVGKALISKELRDALTKRQVKSFALVPIYQAGALAGLLEFRFVAQYRKLRSDECFLLQQTAELCGLHVERLRLSHPAVSAQHELDPRSERLARLGNLLMVRTDSNLRVVEVVGDVETLTGLSRREFLHDRTVWTRMVHAGDLRRLLLKNEGEAPAELKEEIRIINQRTGATHWVLLRALPLFSGNQRFEGWEGFGLDITDKHNAEEEIVAQGRRIEALYAVSRAVQANMDPALAALRGLRELITATRSDCGLGYLVEPAGGTLELVAAEGLSQRYVEEMGMLSNGKTLVQHALEGRKGLIVDDIQNDRRASAEIARREGLRSTIIMPLVFERNILGVIVLFRRRPQRYSAADFDLVAAASAQIALAARDAELFAAERTQASSLAALYRLSHELSRQVTLKEVIAHAFPVIQEELACKRMWLGVINERGTHIAGQAGSGPGVRQNLIDMQIELGLRHDFLDEAIREKRSVIVNAGEPMECSGLNRIIEKLKLGTFVVVPLVALGQVVGVLVVEPAVASTFIAQRKLPLLNSMASEIATVILARRFEARMADAEKMRMAGLLASGIAHNFNNLLQAIMGQASLIEMQVPADSKISACSRMIVEAAARGAGLVKQLFSFAAAESFSPKPLVVQQLLTDPMDLYRSILGSSITLEYRAPPGELEVLGDYSRLQQVLTNLLINAKEAIGQRADGLVTVSVTEVRLGSGEVDPELSPGAYVRIDVEDNGVGMDAVIQARCFEPFFTTKNADTRTGLGLGGSGLGLSSAYSIMKQHDGLLTVRSEPGRGAIFSIYIPEMHAEQKRSGLREGEKLQDSIAVEVVLEGAKKGGAAQAGAKTNKGKPHTDMEQELE